MLICADIPPRAKTQSTQRCCPRGGLAQAQNRVLKKTGAGTPDAYSFTFANKLTNILIGAQNANHRYFYDLAGNLVTSVVNNITNIYFYNAQNKLARVLTYRMQLQQHECVHYLFAYDSLNRRVAITRSNTWSGQTTGEARSDLYDGTIPLAEADGNGNLVRYFVRGVGIAEGTGDMIAEVLWSGGSPDAVFYLSNHRGDTLVVLNDVYNIAARYEYDAFGNVIEQTGYTPRYTFSTKEYLPAAGLYLYQYRAYDPIAGRWTQRDPIDYQDSINLYQFCGNNPVSVTDPDGRKNYLEETDPDHAYNWDVRNRESSFAGNAFNKRLATIVIGVAVGALAVGLVGASVQALQITAAGIASEAPNVADKMTTVTHWGPQGMQGLRAGDWVMKGEATIANWVLSGKCQPWGGHFAKFSNSITTKVPSTSLQLPRGIEIIKAPLGQRIYQP